MDGAHIRFTCWWGPFACKKEEKNEFHVKFVFFFFFFSSALSWIGLAIGLIGAHCFTKVNVPLFVIQFGSALWGSFSIFFSPDPCAAGPVYNNITHAACGEYFCPNGTETFFCGEYHGWSLQNLANNAWFGFSETNCNGVMCDWIVVYALVFTAVTGIFEGANLSGDLKDPNRHIWRGTLIAIYGAFLTYISEEESFLLLCSFRSFGSFFFSCCVCFCWRI